ncbi:MAG: hypothetical protein WC476_08900 [Phycisphaerae bacterium]|jgi:hypothetical protein
MRPIPRNRLPNTVTYSKFDDSGRDNDYDDPVTIQYVAVDKNSTLIRDNNGNILKGATMLIYDNVTSAPQGIIFSEQDKVTINIGQSSEKTLKVVAVGGASVSHHQEVILQ